MIFPNARILGRHGYESLNVASPVNHYNRELVTETGRVEITDKLPMRNLKNAVPPGAKETQLYSFSVCDKSWSSLDRENLTKPTVPNFRSTRSEKQLFPKFALNQKIESTLSLDTDQVISKRHLSLPRIDDESGYCSYSLFLASDAKMDGRLIAKSTGNPCSVQKDDASQISNDYSTETLPVCTAVDSVGASGVVPKFSKTTHHLLITKKTDVHLSKGDQMIRKSIGSAKFNGNVCHGIAAMPHVLGYQEDHFQHPGNSSYGEEKVDRNAIESGFKTESSAETDTMPIDVYESINSHAGLTTVPPHKDVIVERNEVSSQTAVASTSKDVGFGLAKTCLLNMNEDLPRDLGVLDSVNIRELSTSITESLDEKNLFSHVVQSKNSNSIPQQCSHQGLDPSSRWVKRLQSTASDSFTLDNDFLETDAQPSEELHEKAFNRILNSSRTSSEPMLDDCLGNGPQQFDKVVMVLRNRDFSSVDSLKNHWDRTISRAWIQRWCHKQGPILWTRPEAQVACEPEKLKVLLEEFPRKQFPGIAAMALLGKALKKFSPCEFKKRGSFVVWHT